MTELDKLKIELEEAKADLSAHGNILWDRDTELMAGGCFLVFIILFFGLLSWLIMRGGSPATLMRTFTIPLICVMAVLLVLIGYSQDQIAPVMGLLGTVAGYLLGRRESPDSSGRS